MAVTTDLPLLIAVKIKSLAGSIPPITSIIKSISGSETIEFESVVSKLLGIPSRFNFISLTEIFTSSKFAPALEDRSFLLSISNRAICSPTTPQPSMPTFRVFIE
ncbi:unannotated protein [freshwater metagenome]|uniref:Unannotated protein n=1 Tax=freshwater metagenome TaxID=449393 RepID=A0A6J5Z5E7_9ZZZZ